MTVTADEQADPAGVVVLEQPDGGLGGADVAHGDGVGGRAQRGGDRGLVAGLDGDQRGHRAEDAGEPVAGGEHGAGAVLAGQAELEGVLAGDQGGPLLLRGPFLVPQRGDPVVRGGQPEGGLLVVGVEVLLAGVQPGDLGLDAGELRLRAGGPLAGLLQRRGQPADLGLAGLDLAAPRGDLPGQPGQSLAPVGGRPRRGGHPLLLGRQRLLGLLPGRDGRGQRLAVAADGGLDLPLLGPDLLGVGLELVGVPAGALVLRLAGQVPDPLGGQAAGAAEPLAQRRQAVPGLLGPGQGRRLGRGGLLERGLPLGRCGQRRPRPRPGGRAARSRRPPRPRGSR